jgi:hypothetical protein
MMRVGSRHGGALLALGLMLALGACTTTATPYQPADGRFGYSEQQIEDNRYRVSFAGNQATPRQTVENLLLYRAAELTLARGDDHFTVVDRGIEASGTGGGTLYPSVGVGVGSGGNTSFGVGLSTIFGGYGGGATSYTAYADILTFPGPKPADDPQSYDAHELVRRLQPEVMAQGG